MNDLNFTGERVIPDKVDKILWYEHMVRYIFAADFIQGRIVLDAGCGTGYGTDFLAAKGAKHVLGIDNSFEAINYAKIRYKRNNLTFYLMDVTNLSLQDRSVEVVVLFEVIEHLENQKKCLSEITRVLKEEGILIISTPNREVYRLGEEPNPFHTHEFNLEEFHQILRQYFCDIKIFGQNFFAGISITPVYADPAVIEEVAVDHSLLEAKPQHLYFLALCSQVSLKKILHTGKLIHFSYDKDEYLRKLQQELDEKAKWALHSDQKFQVRERDLAKASEKLIRYEEYISTLRKDLNHKDRHIKYLQEKLEHTNEFLQSVEREMEILRWRLSAKQKALLWPTIGRIVYSWLWPFMGFYRVIRPFWKFRLPPEEHFRRALIVGSASKNLVFKVIDSLLRRFPRVQFTVLARDDLQNELCLRWSQLEIDIINRSEYKQNPLRLLTKLWRQNYDVAITVLSGESAFYKHKFVGFLSGARYLMVYNENLDSFFWTLGQLRTILRHLKWRMTLRSLGLNLKYWLSYFLAPLGYFIILIKVLPLLIKAGKVYLLEKESKSK